VVGEQEDTNIMMREHLIKFSMAGTWQYQTYYRQVPYHPLNKNRIACTSDVMMMSFVCTYYYIRIALCINSWFVR